jgi:hypothetical protein
MKKDQQVIHNRYGLAVINEVIPPSTESNYKGGVMLSLLTKEGFELFNDDREELFAPKRYNHKLELCFESNLNTIKLID